MRHSQGILLAFLCGVSLIFDATALWAQEPYVSYVTTDASPDRYDVDSRQIDLPRLKHVTSSPVVTALASSNDGRFLAVAGDDHAIRIIDAQTGETLHILEGHDDWIMALVFSSQTNALYSAGNDGRVLRWDYRFPVKPELITTVPHAVRSLSISSEQNLLAIGGFSDTVLLLDLAANEVKHRLECQSSDQRCVRFSPDGMNVLCGGRVGELLVWDSLTGELVAQFKEHRDRIRTAAFSSDGTRITSVAEDRQVVRYDLETSSVLSKHQLPGSKLMSLCMVNDELVAVAGADNSIHLYDAATNEVIAHLNGHLGTVAVMEPCGDLLASGSFDTTVRLWDLASIESGISSVGRPTSHTPMKMDSRLRIR